MAMDLAPWLAQPIANPAAAYAQGFGQGAQIGAHQAEQKLRQQQMNQQAQQHAVELQQRAIEFSLKLDEERQKAEELKAHQQQQYELAAARINEEAARTAMYGQWHQGDIARRTEYDKLRAANQQNVLAQKKEQQAQNYEMQQKRVAEEAARTAMMGSHYKAETGRRTAVDQAKRDRMDAYNEAQAGGATIAELARMFPDLMNGSVQYQIAEDKAGSVPKLSTLPGSGGPVDVITQPGFPSKIVPKAAATRDPNYAARLNGYKAEIASLQARLQKHPSRAFAAMSDEQLAKVKGINMEGVKEFRTLQQKLNTVSENFAKYRDSQGAASAPVRRWDPNTHSWFNPNEAVGADQEIEEPDYEEEDPEDLTEE